ncbi:methyltransferase domain-containing protein [Thermodesulfobacteriota bacterium]
MEQPHLKQEIKELYGAFAATVNAQEAPAYSFCRKRYGQAELSSVPPTALRLACGCGNPVSLTDIPPGCTVVDLGCGGGIDVIIAARMAEHGKTLGIDLVPGMIRGAQQAVTESGLQQNIFFRVADIEDISSLPRNFADVVLANCVINLCPDKLTVYRNIFRILKPGGVLVTSDPVLSEEIDLQLRERLQATRTNCFSGAVSEKKHLQILKKLTLDIMETDSLTLTPEDLKTIARYPERDSILPLSRDDLLSLQGKAGVMTVKAKRRPLN